MKKISLWICLVVIIATTWGLFPCRVSAQIKTDWSANWIWMPQDGPANSFVCSRKTFNLEEAPGTALTGIAADTKYWLWINGQMAVREGGLKRGPTREDTYFDNLDLAPWLKAGSNTVAIMVWHWGANGFSHNNSGKGGLLFECKAGETVIKSDSSWKMREHPGFGTTGDPQPNWRHAMKNIRFDAALDMPGWELPGFNDSSWPSAVEKGKAPCAPWNKLWIRPIPQWKDYGLRAYENQGQFPKSGTGGTVKATLPYNAQVTPYLKVEGPAGAVIDIRTNHYDFGTDGYAIRTEYVTRDGVQEMELPGWMNGDTVLYTIPAGIKIIDLKYRETGYATEFAGSFHCNDLFLNTLWQKSARTLYVSMRDLYMDCPDRERAQWGDFSTQVLQSFYALDTNATGLGRKAFSNVMQWQMSDKTFRIPVPNGLLRHNYELPVQMLHTVGVFGLGMYHLYSGDESLVADAYPRVKEYLALWGMGGNGLIVHRKGTWDWSDWGQNIDAEVLQNIWYYLALKTASDMAIATGNNIDTVWFEARRASIKANFDPVFWKKTYYSSGPVVDERANALAVVAGLADEPKWDAIRAVLTSTFEASPFMEKYVLEALLQMGQTDDALTRMKVRYNEMVKDARSTLWELWKPEKGHSYNHPWAGGPLVLLSQYVAGVAPDSRGYKEYHVLPQLGILDSVAVVVPSVKGNIAVSIRKQAGKLERFSLSLSSPDHTSATVGIPKYAFVGKISVNGTAVWADHHYLGGVSGIQYVGEDKKYYRFLVAPGKWNFVGFSTGK